MWNDISISFNFLKNNPKNIKKIEFVVLRLFKILSLVNINFKMILFRITNEISSILYNKCFSWQKTSYYKCSSQYVIIMNEMI